MNIAYFLDIPSGLGGAGNLLLSQAAVMKKIHNVIVAIPIDYDGRENPEYAERCEKSGLRHVGLDYRTAFKIQNIDVLRVLRDYEGILSFLRDEKIQFIHTVQLNITVELAARTLNIPNLMNIYQIDEEEFHLPCSVFMPRYQSSDSELYCDLWRKGIDAVSRCMRPVSPIDEIIKKNKDIRRISIVMIGDVCEYKNQLSGIIAAERLLKRGEDIELHILGNVYGEYADKCREYVEKNGLSDRIHIYGFVSNIFPVIKDMDAYFCVSKWESFPSSMVESISYGLTVVSTPVAGVPELMKDGYNAFISKGFSIADIEDALRRFITSYRNGEVSQIDEKAADTWNENFSRGSMRNRLNGYYYDIIDDYNKRYKQEKHGYESFYENKIIKDARNIYNYLSESPYGNHPMIFRTYYYACLKKAIEDNGRVFIWGCGKYGRFIYYFIRRFIPEAKIAAFIDTYKEGAFFGINIEKPASVASFKDGILVISVLRDNEEILAQCKENGFILNKTLWVV